MRGLIDSSESGGGGRKGQRMAAGGRALSVASRGTRRRSLNTPLTALDTHPPSTPPPREPPLPCRARPAPSATAKDEACGDTEPPTLIPTEILDHVADSSSDVFGMSVKGASRPGAGDAFLTRSLACTRPRLILILTLDRE